MATDASILAWESHGQRSLVGYSPWGRKESDTTERLTLLLLEKCLFKSFVHFKIELCFGYAVHRGLDLFQKLDFYQTHDLQVFSPICGLSFLLFMVSFAIQKLLSLIRSHLFIFICIILGERLEKILLLFLSKCVLPMFSSKTFIGSSLTFRSLIHFEFIFVYDVKECSILCYYM